MSRHIITLSQRFLSVFSIMASLSCLVANPMALAAEAKYSNCAHLLTPSLKVILDEIIDKDLLQALAHFSPTYPLMVKLNMGSESRLLLGDLAIDTQGESQLFHLKILKTGYRTESDLLAWIDVLVETEENARDLVHQVNQRSGGRMANGVEQKQTISSARLIQTY